MSERNLMKFGALCFAGSIAFASASFLALPTVSYSQESQKVDGCKLTPTTNSAKAITEAVNCLVAETSSALTGLSARLSALENHKPKSLPIEFGPATPGTMLIGSEGAEFCALTHVQKDSDCGVGREGGNWVRTATGGDPQKACAAVCLWP
jgi:hypothetical protein